MKANHSSKTQKVDVYSSLFCLFLWVHPAYGAAEGVTATSDVHLARATVGESAVVRVGTVNLEGTTINGNMVITSKAEVGEISADRSAQVNVASAHFHQTKVQGNAKIELAARTANITAGQGSTVSVGGFEIDNRVPDALNRKISSNSGFWKKTDVKQMPAIQLITTETTNPQPQIVPFDEIPASAGTDNEKGKSRWSIDNFYEYAKDELPELIIDSGVILKYSSKMDDPMVLGEVDDIIHSVGEVFTLISLYKNLVDELDTEGVFAPGALTDGDLSLLSFDDWLDSIADGFGSGTAASVNTLTGITKLVGYDASITGSDVVAFANWYVDEVNQIFNIY